GREAHPLARPGQQVAPVLAQDLHPAQRPSVTLLLEAIETKRHQPRAPRARFIHPSVAATEDAKAGLGILRDAGLVPTADLLERLASKQAHGAGEDDGVAM